MPRYRIQFSKAGPACYTSHLDMIKNLERGLRRARLPVAYSQGFNPHPQLSYAAPLPVGMTGLDEYVDLELTEVLPAADILDRLNRSLPQGLNVKQVKEVPEKSAPLMAITGRAAYRAEFAPEPGLSQADLERSVQKLLDCGEITITREVKGKKKTVDIRPGIFDLSARLAGQRLELLMELELSSSGNVRPAEVIRELAALWPVSVSPEDFRLERTGLYAGGSDKVSLWNA